MAIVRPYRRSAPGALLLAPFLMLAGCATPPAPPPAATPPPRIPALAAPRQAIPLAPLANWLDYPATAGDWRWSRDAGQSRASFVGADGGELLALRCERTRGLLVIERHGGRLSPATAPADPLLAEAQTQLSITTTSRVALLAQPLVGPGEPRRTEGLAVALPVGDPLLDAMAFSRGRFMVEARGWMPLYLPAWPEVARVVEDCR
jgi:hypothetical protein